MKDSTARHPAAQAPSRAPPVCNVPSPQSLQSGSARVPLLDLSDPRSDRATNKLDKGAKSMESSQEGRERKNKMAEKDVLGTSRKSQNVSGVEDNRAGGNSLPLIRWKPSDSNGSLLSFKHESEKNFSGGSDSSANDRAPPTKEEAHQPKTNRKKNLGAVRPMRTNSEQISSLPPKPSFGSNRERFFQEEQQRRERSYEPRRSVPEAPINHHVNYSSSTMTVFDGMPSGFNNNFSHNLGSVYINSAAASTVTVNNYYYGGMFDSGSSQSGSSVHQVRGARQNVGRDLGFHDGLPQGFNNNFNGNMGNIYINSSAGSTFTVNNFFGGPIRFNPSGGYDYNHDSHPLPYNYANLYNHHQSSNRQGAIPSISDYYYSQIGSSSQVRRAHETAENSIVELSDEVKEEDDDVKEEDVVKEEEFEVKEEEFEVKEEEYEVKEEEDQEVEGSSRKRKDKDSHETRKRSRN